MRRGVERAGAGRHGRGWGMGAAMNRGLNSGARVNDMSRVDYAVIRVL